MGALRKLAALLVVLLFASLARADNDEYFTIAYIGDLQFAAECGLPTTAYDHFDESIDWIIGKADVVDLVISAGDLTYEYGRSIPGWTDTCDCLAAAAPCGDHTNSYGSTCIQCADAEAQACDGGTAGMYCEQTRIRNAFDRLVAAGIPVIWVSGNHDYDQPLDPSDRWTHYKRYLSSDQMPKHMFKEMGTYTDQKGGMHSYHVMEAAGIDWLLLGHGFLLSNQVDAPAIRKWFGGVMAKHDRMLTILIAHILTNATGWYTGGDMWEPNQLIHLLDADPQIGIKISGHYGSTLWSAVKTNDNYHILAGSSGEDVFSYVHDYSYDGRAGGGLPAWVLQDNGGGGVVGMLRIHPRSGSISHYSYSPTELERVEISGGDGQTIPQWQALFPICGQDRRWDIPAAACSRRVETRHVPGRGHIETQNPADLY